MVQQQDLLAVVAEVLEFVDVPLTITDGLTVELPLQVYHKLLQQVLVVPQAEDHEVLEVVLVLLIKVLVVAAQEVQIVVVLRFIMVAQVDQELL
jgi:hypothetical protein